MTKTIHYETGAIAAMFAIAAICLWLYTPMTSLMIGIQLILVGVVLLMRCRGVRT